MKDARNAMRNAHSNWSFWIPLIISLIGLAISTWFNVRSFNNQIETQRMSIMPFAYLGVKGGGSVGELMISNQGKGPAVNIQVELYEIESHNPIRVPVNTLAPGDSVSLVGPLNTVLGEAMGVTRVYVDPDRMGIIGISMQAGDVDERQCELRALVEATDIYGKKYSVSQDFAISQTILSP